MPSKDKLGEQAPRATHPTAERGTRMGGLINPDDASRWLALADVALSRGASESDVDETEQLARKEQSAIKRDIRRRSYQVNRQSNSKQ
jgi:hypothetical protein